MFRRDPLQEAWSRANRLVVQLTNSGIKDERLTNAQTELKAARMAINARDSLRQMKRRRNKELRARGIDPDKKPEHMTAGEFEQVRKTLREAIQPQFPHYKAQMFRLLRQQVDDLLQRLAKAGGCAYAAAYGFDYHTLYQKSWRGETRQERDEASSRIEMGNALLSRLRKWSVEAPLAEGKFRDRGREGATDPRIPASDAWINTQLDVEAQAITERDFDSYTQKLAGKIGLPVERASVIGHLWQCSVLVAFIEADFWNESQRQPVQRWSTKMILNRSVHNTLFNQWPTRRIDKDAP